MTTLDDAWAWYTATRDGARRLARLARHWDEFPWDSDADWMRRGLKSDAALNDLTAERIAGDADSAQLGLDDLAVLVLFGVFEGIVRDWIADRVRPEVLGLKDPTLRHAGDDVLELIAQGSFGRLLDAYKVSVGADLVEHVSQVRRYRNWVAHGRREDMNPAANVTPKQAHDRLSRFLAALRGAGPS